MTSRYADVLAAADRIAAYVHRTPVMTSERLDELAHAELFFKCENLQKVGAFKARGAVNCVFSFDESDIKQGFATHSSGNHGAALARAARLRGVPAHIVVPANAPQVKQDAIEAYGAHITRCEPKLEARERTLARVVAETGARIVHPYDDDGVIAGQGTASLELVDQVPELDMLVTPVGGGGLLAGSSLVCEARGVRLYGAEPTGADDAYRSFSTGERVTSHVPETICDGLQTTVGQRNFDVIRERLETILLVDDDSTVGAMKLIWTRMKQVVEPSSAIVLAAVLANRQAFQGKRVGLVLTGGNVDLENLPF